MGIFHGYSRGFFMGEQFCGRNSVKLPDKWKELRDIRRSISNHSTSAGQITTLRKRALFTTSEKHRLGRSLPMVAGFLYLDLSGSIWVNIPSLEALEMPKSYCFCIRIYLHFVYSTHIVANKNIRTFCDTLFATYDELLIGDLILIH